MPRRRGDEAIVDALRGEGVEYLFGLPGGHSAKMLYDALYDANDIKTVLFRHEEAAGFAAFGYAYLSGKVGVCHATAGPGWSQMLTAGLEAREARIPMLLLCGLTSTKYTGMGALQEFPQHELSAQAGKWSYAVNRADRIPWAMQRAFTIARMDPPGPVYLHVPDDLGLGVSIDTPPYQPGPARARTQADPQALAGVAELILAARHPVLVAGRGVLAAGASEELRAFAELLALPVLTSEAGKSAISERHPLFAGLVGINRNKVAHRVVEQSDCMIWIGSQMGEFETTRRLGEKPDKTIIHIDVDPSIFGRNWMPDAVLAGDARLVLQQLYDTCKTRVQTGHWQECSHVLELQEQWRAYERELDGMLAGHSSPVHPAQVMQAIEKQMDRDAIIISGEGAIRIWVTSHLRTGVPNSGAICSSFGCMGLAVPAALGAKAAFPDRQVIAVTGDGSFQMQMQEMPVAIQHKLPVTWVVCNNDCLGWIKWRQVNVHDNRPKDVDFRPNWDFKKAAEAASCFGVRVERAEDLSAALDQAFEANRRGVAALVDVQTLELEHAPGFLAHYGYGEPFA